MKMLIKAPEELMESYVHRAQVVRGRLGQYGIEVPIDIAYEAGMISLGIELQPVAVLGLLEMMADDIAASSGESGDDPSVPIPIKRELLP